MDTKAKTQASPVVTSTPMMQSKWGATSSQGLLSRSPSPFQNDVETTDTDDRTQRHVVAAAPDDPPPPNVQLKQAKQFGYTFGQMAISAQHRQGNALTPKTLQRHNKKSNSQTPKLPNSLTPKTIQRNGNGSFQASSNIENKISQSKGGGQPLSDSTRNFMESRFNNDFSQVRVHTNSSAVQMNRDLSAQAFTHGNDLYFNSGKYNPESSGGKKLLAHELTHTIQQTGPSTLQPKAEVQPSIQKKKQKKNTPVQKKTPKIRKKPNPQGGQSASTHKVIQNKQELQNSSSTASIHKRAAVPNASPKKTPKITPQPKVQRKSIIRKPLAQTIQRQERREDDGTVNLKPLASQDIASQPSAKPLAHTIQRQETWDKEDGTVNLKPLKAQSKTPHLQRKETWDGDTVYLKPLLNSDALRYLPSKGFANANTSYSTSNDPTPIQTKLTVGAPGDKYEREADQMADRVMSMSSPTVQQSTELSEKSEVQRSPSLDLPDIQETPDIQADVEDREFELGAPPEMASPEESVQRSEIHPTPALPLVRGGGSDLPPYQGGIKGGKSPEESVQRFLSVDAALLQRDDDESDDATDDTEESGDKDSMKTEATDAKKDITAELDSYADPEDTTNTEPQQAGNKSKNLIDKAKSDIADAGSKKKSKKNAKKIKKEADQQRKDAEAQERQEREKEQKKNELDIAEKLKQKLEQEKKGDQELDGVLEETGTEGEGDGDATTEEAGASTDSGEGDPPPPPPSPAGEGLPDPGLAIVPGPSTDKSPKSPDEDPRFKAVVGQTEHLAADNATHDPADKKAEEAQDAAVDDAQALRRGQSSQMNEAGDTQPGIFDREAFVSGLLAILESNKPKTRKDVEEGKGMDGASDAMKGEIDKTQDDAGGELETNALAAPAENPSDAKTVGTITDAATAIGEKSSTETIDAEGAVPQKLTPTELDNPISETQDNLKNLVPKTLDSKISLKLEVGAPGDKYEQEADRMADQVMAMPSVETPAIAPSPTSTTPVQRTDADTEDETTSTDTDTTLATAAPDTTAPDTATSDASPIQRTPTKHWVPIGPEIQMAPGVFIQRAGESDGLVAENPTQDELPVKFSQGRLQSLEKEPGAPSKPSKEIKAADRHLSQATDTFKSEEDGIRMDAISSQEGAIATTNETMFADRSAQMGAVETSQQASKSEDEIRRSAVTQEIQGIYSQTQGNVDGILARMHSRVDAEFARTDRIAKATFERRQKQLFKAWKDDYYGVRHPFLLPWISIKAGCFYVRIKFHLKKLYNWPLWAVHKVLTGLPGEVNQIYDIAKEDYLNVQREGVHRIADIVQEELTAAKAEVDAGRARVQEYVAKLPEDLKEVGQNAADAVMLEFMQLELNVKDQQNSLVNELKDKYEASLSDINKRIEALKAANKGFISQALDALADLAKWILRQVLRVLEPPLKLIPGIGSHVGPFLDAFVDDPVGIMKTLFGGIAKGFELFGQNVTKHLPKILFTWLLGSGINIIFPKQFDLKGILDILLQILGVSGNAIIGMAQMFLPGWASELIQLLMEKGGAAFSEFRETLTELGVPNLVMKFFDALVSFPKDGIMSIWDFLKDMMGSLKEKFIMTLITQLIVPEVVVAGIQWLIGLLNPAAGIVKIAKAIVDVIIFFVRNMDMVKAILESIGSAMQAVISKNIGTVARAVEYAIVTIMPMVLGLFVALLGLGGIPQKIQKVTEKVRAPVDKTIGKVFDKFGKLLAPFAALAGGAGLAGLRKGRGRSGGMSGKSKSTGGNTAGSASTKKTSTPPTNNSQSSKQSVKDANNGKSKTQDKNTKGKDTKKKESEKDRKKREQQESIAATRKALTKAYDDVEDEAKKVRDPDKVKGKLTGIKSKNKLSSLKLKKKGKKKFYVEAKAKPVSSGGSKTARRHATSSSAAVPTIQASTEAEIEAAQGKGQSLPTAIQAQMEQAIGDDFSGVKIHADAEGDRLSRSLEADAFTVQRDVFFKQGSYNPQTSSGKQLIAHELTHVSQNNRDEGQVQRKTIQRAKSSNPWTDKNNKVRVKKKKLKATKKGGSFTLSSSLMSTDDVLPDVARKLKPFIKKARKHTIVKPYLATLKRQYDLKSIKVTGIKLGGRKYNIEAEQESQTAQKSAAPGSSMPVAPTIEGTIQRAKAPGHGQAMSASVREPMENAFGYDFSSVRIHADAEGDRISRSLNANALTTGQDIFFRQGQYNPIQRKGQHLLAHELTHVVQQSSDTSSVQASPATSPFPSSIVQRQGEQPPPSAMGQISPVFSQIPLVQRDGEGAIPTSTEGEADGPVPHVSAEETSGAMPDMGAMDGSTMAMAGTAMNVVGTGMAVAGAVNTAKNVADAVRGTGEAHMIKRIKGNKLTMYVVLANIPKPKKSFNFNMTRGDWGGEQEGLPPNVINDIVTIIQAIVSQDPDDDVVAKKLHFVRSKFELSMVKLMGSAEIGDSFEYLIRVQGKAKSLKPSKIASFLKNLAKGGRKSTDAIAPAATETASSTTRSRSSSMATDSGPEGSPPTNATRPRSGGSTHQSSSSTSKATTSNATPTSTNTRGEGMTTDAMSSEGMNSNPNPQPSAPVMDEEEGANQQKDQKGTTNAQPSQFDVGTTIERIDPLTVDIIVRANPQK